jgi:hypothetical protein
MSPRRSLLGRVAPLLTITLLMGALTLAGCGKYGKPIRAPEHRSDESEPDAERAETRYTLEGATVAAAAAAGPPKQASPATSA